MRKLKSTNSNWDSGRAQFATYPSDVTNNYAVTAGQMVVCDVPEGAHFVLFTATDDIWVAYLKTSEGAFTFPDVSGDITDGSSPELNPTMRVIDEDVKRFAIVCEADGNVVLSYYG